MGVISDMYHDAGDNGGFWITGVISTASSP